MDLDSKIEKRFVGNFLSYQQFKSSFLISSAVVCLCLVVSVVFWNSDYGISSYLMASPESVFVNGQWWRLFTTSFIHSNFEHLLANCFTLFYMSFFICSHYGFWIFPILSFTMGALVNYLVLISYDQNIGLLGASGVVYYLWGFWLILYILIQRHLPISIRVLKALGVGIVILFPTNYSATTSYLAHALGFTIGILNGLIYYYLSKERIRSFERFEIYEVPELENIPNDSIKI